MAKTKQIPKSATSLADLHGDPQNARKHNPRNIGQVQSSLQKYGAARSIVIDENNQIIAGHGVVEAAGLAGIERVQVVDGDGKTIIAVRRSGLTKKQKQELGIADNRGAELAEWDADVLAALAGDVDLGEFWNKDELAALLADVGGNDADDPGADVDRAAELQAKWGTALGQLWQVGRHRLLVGDCTVAENVARLMGGEKANLMVTDPPYGVEYDPMWRQEALGAADRRAGKVENDDRADWREAWALFDGDIIYCWSAMLTAGDVLQSFAAVKFNVHAEIVWAKQRPPFGRGHYVPNHEACWYLVRNGKTASWIGDEGMQFTVWDIAADATADGGHGTQKPVECMARPIRNHKSDIVYDPFLGSGTTLVACEKLGRIGRGMELSAAYAAVTLERLSGLGLTPERVD